MPSMDFGTLPSRGGSCQCEQAQPLALLLPAWICWGKGKIANPHQYRNLQQSLTTQSDMMINPFPFFPLCSGKQPTTVSA